jgi:signal transduction histidine kinase
VDSLQEICENFPANAVEFKVFGNTSHVPIHAWNMLENCLQEALTNAAKHAKNNSVFASLDVTPHIVRLYVENNYSKTDTDVGFKTHGSGLRNLRYRAAAVGGSLSTDSSGEKFRVVCVIPII